LRRKNDDFLPNRKSAIQFFSVAIGYPAVTSFNDFLRPHKNHRRDRQAKSLGGLKVDHQLKLRRLLDRQVSRLGTF
jgi:hypothetical protein